MGASLRDKLAGHATGLANEPLIWHVDGGITSGVPNLFPMLAIWGYPLVSKPVPRMTRGK